MTAYALPDSFRVNRFEMRQKRNQRTFTGPYTPTTQVIDLLGERWIITMSIAPARNPIEIAAREAFSDRLCGQVNLITLGHRKLRAPQGTMRGSPVVSFNIAQLANTGTITTSAGLTLLAGDMIGLGGQLVRIMADTVADGAGHMPIEFQGRARTAISAGAAVTWNAPTANFMLTTADGIPTPWTPDMAEGASFDLVEIY